MLQAKSGKTLDKNETEKLGKMVAVNLGKPPASMAGHDPFFPDLHFMAR
jgi:hypothetical protein